MTLKVIGIGVRDDGLQWNIPRIRLQRRHFLEVVREADESRALPLAAVSEECETSIVVTTAHTQAVAAQVERDEWRKDYIQRSRVDEIPFRKYGFRNAEHILFRFTARSKRHETELPTV